MSTEDMRGGASSFMLALMKKIMLARWGTLLNLV